MTKTMAKISLNSDKRFSSQPAKQDITTCITLQCTVLKFLQGMKLSYCSIQVNLNHEMWFCCLLLTMYPAKPENTKPTLHSSQCSVFHNELQVIQTPEGNINKPPRGSLTIYFLNNIFTYVLRTLSKLNIALLLGTSLSTGFAAIFISLLLRPVGLVFVAV